MKKKVREIFLVLLLMGLSVFSSLAHADIMLNVPFFSQKDVWKDDFMVDGTNINIRNYGCLMTSFAMTLKYYGVNNDPRIFNSWLKSHNGYDGSGVMDWPNKVADYAQENSITITLGSLITGQNYQTIHDELEAGYPVIVKVPYALGHWMIVVSEKEGEFYCWDPLNDPTNQKLVHINKYGSYEKYLTVRGPVPNNNPYLFSFPNHSPEGWTTGFDTEPFQGNDINTWGVHITGNNPGIVSPEFSAGLMASNTSIKFSARVLGNSGNPAEAFMYIKDETGSWNNPISLGAIATNQDYREYFVDLSALSLRSNLEIRQFSLELTNGGNGTEEYWAIDWLTIYHTVSYPAYFLAAVSDDPELPLVEIPVTEISESEINPPPPEETCASPQNMSVSINGNNVALTWENGNAQVLDYEIQIWENNGPMINSLVALSPPFSYEESALVEDREYKIIGKTYCSSTLASDWSSPIFFHIIPTPTITAISIM